MSQKRRKRQRRARSGHTSAREVTHKITGPPPPPEFSRVLHEAIQSGWIRYWRTPSLLLILAAAVDDHDGQGIESLDFTEPIWEQPRDSEEASDLEGARDDLKRFSDFANRSVAVTLGDLLELASHYGLVTRAEFGWDVPIAIPLIGESGVLTQDEIKHEDELRWRDRFEPVAQSIIRSFVEDRRTEWITTVQEVAAYVEADIESMRQGLAVLVLEGDFVVEPEPESIAVDAPITITVDWEAFDRCRISLGGFTEGNPGDD